MLTLNCTSGTIAPYIPDSERPWNRHRLRHLFRRMGFGITPQDVEQLLPDNPLELVDQLLDQAQSAPLLPEPEWADWNVQDYENFQEEYAPQLIEWSKLWLQDMIDNSVRSKLVLFWSNHFVTKIQSYLCPSYLYRYHRVLETHALGNFKDFVHAIGTTPAMLVFLNGVQNTRVEPNENYARELYELFTLGRDNGYTQEDITETARALTGYNGILVYCEEIEYVNFTHDNGEKTIFGQTGNWGYDDVINILFEQRAEEIATYICGKLYQHFVNPEIDADIVAELAATFLANDFELLPVYRQLFKSEHFFDDTNIGVVIKSPIDFHIQFLKETTIPYDDQILEYILYFSSSLGQRVYDPTDVSGWAGDRSWISNSTLTMRWQSMRFFIFTVYENAPELLRQLAKLLAGADETDPYMVTKTVVDAVLPKGLQQQSEYDNMTATFKMNIPQNYFDENSWNLDWETVPAQMGLLLDKITRQPEFQLM